MKFFIYFIFCIELFSAAPDQPTDLNASDITDGNITLDWAKTYSNESNTTIYETHAQTTSIVSVLPAGFIPPYTISGLDASTEYSFIVSPQNADGETNSSEIYVTTTHDWSGLMGECAAKSLGKPKGHIPTKRELASISSFSCSYNGNADIGDICDLTSAAVIDMRGNWIRQPIPSCIGGLTELETLDFSGNMITGPVPPEIGMLYNLKTLDLSNNKITKIPPEIGNLSSLVELNIAFNEIFERIPPEIGNLSSLEQLYLQGNRFFDAIPSELGDMLYLKKLRLNQNSLRGEIPVELADLDLTQPSGLGLHENCRLVAPADENISDGSDTDTVIDWVNEKASLYRGYVGVRQTGGNCWTPAMTPIIMYLLSDTNGS